MAEYWASDNALQLLGIRQKMTDSFVSAISYEIRNLTAELKRLVYVRTLQLYVKYKWFSQFSDCVSLCNVCILLLVILIVQE